MPQQQTYSDIPRGAQVLHDPATLNAGGYSDLPSGAQVLHDPATIEPTVTMTSPSGVVTSVPRSKAQSYVTNGYTVGQPLPSDKISTDATGQRHLQVNANAPQFGAVKNFALNAAQTVWPSDRGPIDQAVYEAKQLYNHPADMISESLKAANPIRWVTDSAGAEGQAAIDAAKKHDYEGAIAHAGYSVVPVIGHTLGDAGEQIRSGDVSGGLGKTAGVAAQIAMGSPEVSEALAHPATALTKTIPEAAGRATGKVLRTVGGNDAVAAAKNALDRATIRVSNTVNKIFGEPKPMFTSPYPEDAVDLGQAEVIPPANRKGPGEIEPEQVGAQPAQDENVLAGRQGVRVRQAPALPARPKPLAELPSLSESSSRLPARSRSTIESIISGQGRQVEATAAEPREQWAAISQHLEDNPNMTPGQIRELVARNMDPSADMGGVSDSFAGANETPIGKRKTPIRQEPTARSTPSNGEIQPSPLGTFPGITNGYSAAAYALSHENLSTLQQYARNRGIPFSRGGDQHATLIGRLVDSLQPHEITEFEAAAAQRGLHPSPRPESRQYMAERGPMQLQAQPQATEHPGALQNIINQHTQPARATTTAANMEDQLRQSLAAKGITPPDEEAPQTLQQIINGERRATPRTKADILSARQKEVQAQGIIQRAGLNPENFNQELGTFSFSDPANRSPKVAALPIDDLIQGGPQAVRAQMDKVLSEPEPIRVGKNEPKPAAAPSNGAGSSPDNPISPHQLQPGQAAYVKVNELVPQPKKYQYKGNTDAAGVVTGQITGSKYSHDLANALSYHIDPEDNVASPVNGHNRRNLAVRSGETSVLARRLDAPDVATARKIGALQNISEGKGTQLDAANFFREEKITPEDLRDRGIAISEGTAQQGLALAKLDPMLFEKVRSGQWTESRGATIGNATADPAEQEAIAKLIRKGERNGKELPNGQVESLAHQVVKASKYVEQGQDLFGAFNREHSTALERAEMDDYIQRQITGDKRVFGSVASESKAKALSQVAGQNITAGENAKISTRAAQELELYRKLSDRTGEIDEMLDNAARSLANGYENSAHTKAKYAIKIREALRKYIPDTEGDHPAGSKGASGPGTSPQAKTQKGVMPFFGSAGDFNA